MSGGVPLPPDTLDVPTDRYETDRYVAREADRYTTDRYVSPVVPPVILDELAPGAVPLADRRFTVGGCPLLTRVRIGNPLLICLVFSTPLLSMGVGQSAVCWSGDQTRYYVVRVV